MVLKEAPRGLEKKFLELCAPIVEESGYRLYDLDYLPGSQTLRVFIEDPKTGTAQLEDCAAVDKALTPSIDGEDWVPESFVLEVSSPGVYRSLNTREHFDKVVGEKVCLQLGKKFEELLPADFSGREQMPRKLKSERKLVAELVEVDSSGLWIKVDDYEKLLIEYQSVKRANLEADITI